MGMSKADYLRKLCALHADDVVDGNSGAAFQTAVWDIVYDANFKVTDGMFKASGAPTALAQAWLTDVKTSTSAYTPASLIALRNPTVQDQITVATTPLPSVAVGGLTLLGSLGLKRRQRPVA